MSLQEQLTAASTREQYIAVLKVTLTELATALCRLSKDGDLPLPYRVTFRDRSRWHSRIAELWIGDSNMLAWIKQPDPVYLTLPISGRLTSANGRTVAMGTLE